MELKYDTSYYLSNKWIVTELTTLLEIMKGLNPHFAGVEFVKNILDKCENSNTTIYCNMPKGNWRRGEIFRKRFLSRKIERYISIKTHNSGVIIYLLLFNHFSLHWSIPSFSIDPNTLLPYYSRRKEASPKPLYCYKRISVISYCMQSDRETPIRVQSVWLTNATAGFPHTANRFNFNIQKFNQLFV